MRSVSKKLRSSIRVLLTSLFGAAIFLIIFQAGVSPRIAQATITCVQGEDTHTEAGPTCINGTPLNADNNVTTPTTAGNNNPGKSDPFEQFAYWIAIVIYTFTVGLGSAVAWLGSNVLNYAVQFSLDSQAYNLDFISTGWTMLRDIANMSFIFILVYIAIQVMFQAQTHGTLERLVKVLAVALIINFSFFGTRVVIDAGNLISVQFYNAIVGSSTDLTTSIMNGLNFTSALNENSFKQVSQTIGGGSLSALISFAFIYIVLGAALFMLAAAFVTAGVKFIFRIAMLWVSIVTAPLALVAWSFGGGGGHGSGHGGGNYFGRWLKNLINHALYPTIFLFVLLLITNFMKGLTAEGGFGSINVTDSGWQGLVATLANIIVRLAFVLVMLYFALKSSDYFEVAGSSFAKTFGNNVAFGLPAWTGRTILGGGSRLLADKTKAPPGSIRVGAADFLAKRSFDVRAAKVPFTKIGVPEGLVDKLGYGKPGGKGGFDEAKHHKEAEAKKVIDAEVKKINEHGDGAAAEIREQAKFQREYDRKYGTGALNRKVKDLTAQLEHFRHESVDIAKRGVEATDKAGRDAAGRDLKNKQNEIKSAETQLKAITGVGKKVVEEHNKEHKQEIALKLMSSGKVRDYMIGQKLMTGKSNTEKLKDAAKAVSDEDKESEGGDSHTSGGEGHTAPTHDSHSAGGSDHGGGAHH